MLRKVQVYRTHDVPGSKLKGLLDILNESEDSPQPGHFNLAPLDESEGLASIEVWGLHWKSLHTRDATVAANPVVILDGQTLKDDTVVVMSCRPLGYDDGTGPESNAPLSLRFIPEMVPLAVVNLQIGNQTLDTVRWVKTLPLQEHYSDATSSTSNLQTTTECGGGFPPRRIRCCLWTPFRNLSPFLSSV